jgi:hypothetical protein
VGKINKLGSFKSLHRKKASSQKIGSNEYCTEFSGLSTLFLSDIFSKSTPVALSVNMKTGLLNLLCSF